MAIRHPRRQLCATPATTADGMSSVVSVVLMSQQRRSHGGRYEVALVGRERHRHRAGLWAAHRTGSLSARRPSRGRESVPRHKGCGPLRSIGVQHIPQHGMFGKLHSRPPPPTIASEVDALQGPNVQARKQTRSLRARPPITLPRWVKSVPAASGLLPPSVGRGVAVACSRCAHGTLHIHIMFH